MTKRQKDRQHNDQKKKYKQRSTKHYKENWTMRKKNPRPTPISNEGHKVKKKKKKKTRAILQ